MPLPIWDQTNTTHFAQGISVMNRRGMSYWRFAVLLAVVAFAPIAAVANHIVVLDPDAAVLSDVDADAVSPAGHKLVDAVVDDLVDQVV